LIRVNIKELEGKKIVEYDLYTENGKLVCPRGTPLTPGKILQLSYVKLYREKDSALVAAGSVQPSAPTSPPLPPLPPVVEAIDEILEEPPDFDSKIDEAIKREVLTSTRGFLKDIETGKSPDLAICEVTRDKLVEEVASKVEEVDYLGQLRMFDEYTYSHNVNVSALSVALGIRLGLDEKQIKDLALATLLHDIGKMRIPKEVLNKPGRLTEKEFEIMKLHAPLGSKIIKDELKLSPTIYRVALEHQERYSGSGYPRAIKEDEISFFAQICAIADVYDALCSKRVYKPARTSKESIKIMLSEGSKSFNPGLLYKFIQMCNYSDS
jgi:HD-GYP domain-containing protein (c-di-GMP phosphodiesterase class II)